MLASAVGAEEPSSEPAAAPLDVVFALDTSTSAIAPSGADIDGDGRAATQKLFLGFIPIRPKRSDSLLAAELRAVRGALERLDARTTRVGVVGYAGDPGDFGKRGAEVLAPLTRDYAQVRTALETLARRGPKGMTDLSAGIDLAATQLRPADPAAEDTQRVIVLLSDGRPTLPHRGEPVTNRSDSVAAAQRAARSEVRILVHGIGPDPVEPLLRQIAEAAKGQYLRVDDAAQIDLLAGIQPSAR